MYKILNKTVLTLGIILIVIGTLFILFRLDFSQADTKWGVTFSPYYAEKELGLNWRETYSAILDDLQVDHIRLSAYWDETQPEPDKYKFSDLDWQIDEAGKRDIDIILAVGRRLPRWPECHSPRWLNGLTPDEIYSRQIEFVKTVIGRYDRNKNIKVWQIENEPYLGIFGECPEFSQKLFSEEIASARELSQKPILITDSGELSTWVKAAKAGGDILGTTLYRTVHSKQLGYWHYPLPPLFYIFKSWWIRTLFDVDKVIIAELQTESWHTDKNNLMEMTQTEHDRSLSIKKMADNIKFAKRTGMPEVYLWGAEWWYFMKENQNQPGYWEEAKKLWQKQ